MSESIRENGPFPRLPDCCNLGIWLRVLLAVNLGGLAVAFARAAASSLLGEFMALAALLEPVVLASLLALCVAQRFLMRLDPRAAAAVVLAIVLALTALFHALFMTLGGSQLWRALTWAGLGTLLLLGYFDLRARAQLPALAEARLLALTSRIRPHFLFNSINAVLGVLRSDPRRAERALEGMADLFRALMRDNRELVPLSDELALARQYLDLEKLRLGERLQVRWEIDSCPVDTLVPPLMLQPLLENAVYHGIEPAEHPGELLVRMAGDPGKDGRMIVEISNPLVAGGDHQRGNRMALANIRERLMLYYDLEARLEIAERDGRYTVHIIIPNRRQ
ncbi:sensor histidine kinase [Sulfurisoma sediminicola]|uniref:Two-component system sensor histidine kinase AlgZ n=1 Tax=Sulfurisoma sediminicola TaxID=1381557 RepID=A0A497X7Z7_9PROT|nr:histidine kinase [Sulfurisoma sediminicola]RLJ62087.1 two-component system sensor histidine kinase AlgZ [Sulfurisoma sediminicola]